MLSYNNKNKILSPYVQRTYGDNTFKFFRFRVTGLVCRRTCYASLSERQNFYSSKYHAESQESIVEEAPYIFRFGDLPKLPSKVQTSVAEVNYLLWGMINRLAWEDGCNTMLSNPIVTYSSGYAYRSLTGGIMIMRQWYEYLVESKEPAPRFETITGKLAWVYYGWQWAVEPHVPAPEHEAITFAKPNFSAWPHHLTWSAGGNVNNRTFKGNVQ